MMPASTFDQPRTFPSRVDEPVYGGAFRSGDGGTLPFVLPGELVRVGSHPMEVLEPSPGRVTPGCVHFGQCGGCHYQQRSLRDAGGLEVGDSRPSAGGCGDREDVPAIETRVAAEWGYRNRIRLRIEPEGTGFSRRVQPAEESNEFLPIVMCPHRGSTALAGGGGVAAAGAGGRPNGALAGFDGGGRAVLHGR